MAIVVIDGTSYREIYVGSQGPYLVEVGSELDNDDAQVAIRYDIPVVPTAGNVTAETNFGGTPNNGVSSTYSRSDHTHGSPPNPLAGGQSVTVTLARLTPTTGTEGSLTFTNGILTGHVDPT